MSPPMPQPQTEAQIPLTMADLRRLLTAFLDEVPARLILHPETAPIARAIDHMQLSDHLAGRFTLAVVGAMKAGKSTLVNALVGQELAPTGVSETTATINRFRFGPAEACRKFRVHWRDGSTADLPITEIRAFVFGSDRAVRTHWLELFAQARFLERVELVDTPGGGSVEAAHGELTRSFLGERESRDWGGRADAILYALTPAALHADGTQAQELLTWFGAASRLPGASPANSIAVLQKWETLEPDPLAARDRLVATARKALSGQVWEVLAVSGLIGLACLNVDPGVWARLARLAREASQEVLDELLSVADLFVDEVPGAGLPVADRRAVREALPWPVLRFAVRLAQRRGLADGPALAQAMWEISGIDQLRALLEQRFGAITDLVRAGTILRRTRTPCGQALALLRELVTTRSAALACKEQRRRALVERNDPTLAEDCAGLAEDVARGRDDLARLAESERVVDRVVDRLERAVEAFDGDLDALDRLAGARFTELERAELRCLFGGGGTALDLAGRLGRPVAPLAHAEARLQVWQGRRWSGGGDERRLSQQAAERYQMIVTALESMP